MRKKIPFTVILGISMLVASCSNLEVSQSPQPEVEATEVITPVEIEEPKLLTAAPDQPNPPSQAQIEQYIAGLVAQGFVEESQGIWLQNDDTLLASHQGTTPLPAASLTKIATTLATLATFEPDHQFITEIGTTGTVKDGVVQGDLVIVGDQDPFFVWENAIAIGNLLNEKGITRVTGDLIIVDKFYMNFEANPTTAGTLFQQGINSSTWSSTIQSQYNTLPPNTPKPQVQITGVVKTANSQPNQFEALIRHESFPVAELLKQMNQYSNNTMAEMLANTVGGAQAVAQKAAKAARVPQTEIQLINGSGLGEENRISPRATVAMFRAINEILAPHKLTVGDVVAITGKDVGILNSRAIPPLTLTKSGSLNNVSALAGALPTKDNGTVWFAMLNYGSGNLDGFRNGQELLLHQFSNQWGKAVSLPVELNPSVTRQGKGSRSILLIK